MKAHMKPLFKNKPKSLRKINFINNLYSTTFSKKKISLLRLLLVVVVLLLLIVITLLIYAFIYEGTRGVTIQE